MPAMPPPIIKIASDIVFVYRVYCVCCVSWALLPYLRRVDRFTVHGSRLKCPT
jgi:hypothetical protein